ncbi:MAG: hypothetical protein IJ716_06760 [Lachnospiraceae bacterium]|nr:hypothetical protein [Lachnospiraceae bacterium]
MQWYDPNSYATNPGGVSLSREKFREARNCLPLFTRMFVDDHSFEKVDQWLRMGDTNPAIVKSVDPLIISAYAQDVDAVLFLKFPKKLVQIYGLEVGTRLVTSNIFHQWDSKDVIQGEFSTHAYGDFIPIVQLFLSDEVLKIIKRPETIPEEMWERVNFLTKEKEMKYPKIKPRNGFAFMW